MGSWQVSGLVDYHLPSADLRYVEMGSSWTLANADDTFEMWTYGSMIDSEGSELMFDDWRIAKVLDTNRPGYLVHFRDTGNTNMHTRTLSMPCFTVVSQYAQLHLMDYFQFCSAMLPSCISTIILYCGLHAPYTMTRWKKPVWHTWGHGLETFQIFIKNSLNPSLQLIMEWTLTTSILTSRRNLMRQLIKLECKSHCVLIQIHQHSLVFPKLINPM